jgi:hypothetical protein
MTVSFAFSALAEDATTTSSNLLAPINDILVGNDRDAHGCIGSAGYSWCEFSQKCIRPWIEKCTSTTTPKVVKQLKATSTPKTIKKQIKVTQVDAVCISEALDKRDNAIIAGWDKYASDMKKALLARREAIKSAFNQTDKKKNTSLINKAWASYNAAMAKIKKDFTKTKNAAWKQYNTDRKACKVNSNVDSDKEKTDGSL